MPFTRPTLTELIDRVSADMSSRVLGVDGAVLRRSLLGVIARAEAGAVHLLYGYLDWIAKNAIIDTAESEILDRWAAVWGINRKPATFASGTVTFTGANGSVIPAGTILQRQDGQQYELQGAVTISGGTGTGTVESLSTGLLVNMLAGEKLFLVSPVSGVQSSVTVASGIFGGVDIESDDLLRERLLERIQNPPQGGSESDYKLWAKEVPGVTRVWVYPQAMGAGTLSVLFVTDDAPGDIIPDAGTIADVQDYIDERRPVTADVYVAAPIADELDITIKISPNTASVQAAVLAEFQDLLTRDAEPGGTILISRLREAASIATGESNNEFVTPTADVAHDPGHMAVLGTVTFQSF